MLTTTSPLIHHHCTTIDIATVTSGDNRLKRNIIVLAEKQDLGRR